MSQAINYLHSLLKLAVTNNVSDIHLRSGCPPFFRKKGELNQIKAPILTDEILTEISQNLLKDPQAKSKVHELKEFDGSFQLAQICRVRYNFLRNQGKIGLVFRIIKLEVPTIDGLGFKPIIKKVAGMRRGMILVTGATGSGKSSTLASMIEHINQTRSDHVLTIEDPIEFIYKSKKSLITQREIGTDSSNFHDALRSALRQDPDVILIGELRDIETVNIALKAAETGHVVFATVHTTNALTTISRIISMFPPEEQVEVRKRLADCLQATVSQRLLPIKDKEGRVCAQEIMVVNKGIRSCILEEEPLSNIYTYIQSGYLEGASQSFDQVLVQLFKDDQITLEVGKDAASSPTNFIQSLQFGEGGDNAKYFKQEEEGLELDLPDKEKDHEKKSA